MTDRAGAASVQLLRYAFGADAQYGGRRLVGALERMESGGPPCASSRALFVRRDPETGQLEAVNLHSRGAGSMVASVFGAYSLRPTIARAAAQPLAVLQDAFGASCDTRAGPSPHCRATHLKSQA